MNKRIDIALAVIIFILTANVLILSSVPPVSKDALAHHLAVPKLYLEQGGIYEIPTILFSYFPMNVDLLYIFPLYLGNDIAPKYIHLGFALLTGLLIFLHLNRKTGRTYALFGVVCFLSVPVILKLSTIAYVDLGLVFFTTAALLCLLKWVESNFSVRPLIIAAVFCGLALGTKYNGLISFCLLTLFVPVLYVRHNRTAGSQWRAAGHGVLFFFIALVIFSPWMIRNFVWKGNPVYPLYNNLFAARDQAPEPISEDSSPGEITGLAQKPASGPLSHFTYRGLAFGESGWQIALIPVRVFFQGKDNTPKYFDGVLNPYLFFFPILAFLFIRGDPPDKKMEKTLLGVFSILFLLLVFLQEDMRIRWITPIIPPLVILSVYGLQALNQAIDQYLEGLGVIVGKLSVTLVFGLLLAMNIQYMVGLFDRIAPLEYITGQVNRPDYISRYRPAYKLHEHVGRTLPADSRILGLFMGNRRYYSRRDIIFEDGIFKRLFNRSNFEQALVNEFNSKGITHLMLKQDLFEEWVSNNFEKDDIFTLKAFFQTRLTRVYTTGGYILYELNIA